MTSYHVQIIGLEKLQLFKQKIPTIISATLKQVANTEGKNMYNEINNNTRVKTGRLKRGNMMEISDTGFVYWNNVPYAKHMDTGPRGNRYVTNAFNKYKPKIIQTTNTVFSNQMKSQLGSR
jgi:hypothetical protein